MQSSTRSHRRLRVSLFAVLTIALLFVVAFIAYSTTKAPASVNAASTPRQVIYITPPQPFTYPETKTTHSDAPAPAQPAPVATPVVRQAAPAPVPVARTDRVVITAIGLNSPIVSVGKTSDNAIDVHPSLVGWYDRSATFGAPGAAFLDGHNPGVFRNLHALGIGAPITVERASGETLQYTVVYTETVPLEGIDMRKALRPFNGASEGLNLMTCVGTYNPRTGTTDQRFIAYAVRS
jgi:sortase (surface protein transpeptidase)